MSNCYDIVCNLHLQYLSSEGYKRTVEYKINIYEFYDEARHCKIKIESDYSAFIYGLKSASRDEAIAVAKGIYDSLCKSLSLSIQTNNYDVREYQPNIYFHNSDIYIIREKLEDLPIVKNINGKNSDIFLTEHINMRDGIHSLQISCELLTDNIESFYYATSGGADKEFYIDTIYRALQSNNIESKYFALFTIIEKIETKYSYDNKLFLKIFDDNQQNSFKDKIDLFLKDVGLSENSILQTRGRFFDIIKKATLLNRAEKLCIILHKIYNIDRITKGLINYETRYYQKSKNGDICKIEQFINARNMLFHGGAIEQEQYNKMVQLTNELLALCEKIFLIEMDN